MIPILFENEHFWVIDKPEGMYIHPPESTGFKVPREQILLYVFRDQVEQYIYPVHRLDFSASGLLIFAKSSEAAKELNLDLASGKVHKLYQAIVRGWPEDQSIEKDLKSDSSERMLPSKTRIQLRRKILMTDPVGNRGIPAHYAWVEAIPETGRYHQIRRHLNHIAHPIVGDSDHGDSRHNKYVKEKFGINGLNLRCTSLEWSWRGESLCLQAPTTARWLKWDQIFNEYSS